MAGPENFDLQHITVPKLKEDEALVEVEMVALSAWQSMRTKDFRNFIRPFDIGELISCDSFGHVIESRNPSLKPGMAVVGRQGWQDYAAVRPEHVNVVSRDYSAEEWLTALSSPGQTSYLAFWQKVQPRIGETLVVSSAAGAIGSYAVQLGKIAGARVVGIAGGSRKCGFVQELGADATADYKSEDFCKQLSEACPDGVHLYFDAVGGVVSDAVHGLLAKQANILLVGRIAANNSPQPEQDMANLRHVWSQEATVHAFNRYAYKELYGEVNRRLGKLLRSGQLKMHNCRVEGMANTPAALRALLEGRYLGKVLVRYRDHEGNCI